MSGWPSTQPEAEAIPAPIEDEAAFLARRNHEIQMWLNNKESSVKAAELERQCRDKVTTTLFPTPKKGTQRYQLTGGYAVKLVHVITYTLGDKNKVDDAGMKVPIRKQVEALLGQIAELGNEGSFLADKLIKWKPELDAKEYEALDGENPTHVAIKQLIDAILLTKPGAPQLTWEEPNAAHSPSI